MPASRKLSASKEADRLFGLIVRHPGVCEHCKGGVAIQCAHGFSRRYRATRWDLRNAWPICRADHMYFTHHPLEWDDWMVDRLGIAGYADLRDLAVNGATPDPRDVVAVLRPIWQSIERAA